MNKSWHTPLLVLMFIVLSLSAGIAQTNKAFVRKARKALTEGNYAVALNYYQRLASRDSSNVDAWYKAGEAAMAIYAFERADQLFGYAEQFKSIDELPNLAYKRGLAKQQIGRYDEAIHSFQQFLQTSKSAEEVDRTLIPKAQAKIATCEAAQAIIEKGNRGDTIINLAKVNTPNSEFGAYEYDGNLYYTSLRFERKRDEYYPDRAILSLFKDGEKERLPIQLSSIVRNEGHIAINAAEDKLFFTVCDFIEVGKYRCDIYYAAKENEEWGIVRKLSEIVNESGYTTTQPNLGVDKTGSEWLFFTSDRPGGKGKMDVWASKIHWDGGFFPPINLPFNTSEDDVTPFFHTPTQTLYFSSKGYGGLGGLDILAMQLASNGEWSEPMNLGLPYNSSYNDAYYFLNPSGEKAYLSSNRLGNITQDSVLSTCCPDIYQVDIAQGAKIDLLASTFLHQSVEGLNGTTITLFNLTDEWEKTITGDSIYQYAFQLESDKNYKVVAAKEGFSTDTVTFDTKFVVTADTLIEQTLYLGSPVRLEVATYNVAWGGDRSDLSTRTNAQPLNDVHIVLNNLTTGATEIKVVMDSNESDFELLNGHEYQLSAYKESFQGDSLLFDTKFKMNGDTTIRKRLYLSPPLELLVQTFDGTLGREQATILNGARVVLNNLTTKTTQANPNVAGYQCTFGVAKDSDYQLIASKDGYEADTLYFDTRQTILQSTTITKQLYLKLKAEGFTQYLPIPLYFDNDEPDRRTIKETTTKTYEQAYNTYYPKKELFVRKYASGMQVYMPYEQASQRMESFFEDDVKAGFKKLTAFCGALVDYLGKGNQVKIVVQGYASPLAASDYNQKLTKRRIYSIKNYFRQYDNGVLRPYLDNKYLQIIERPNGEDQAREGVSDDAKNEIQSIYSVEASRERRVEIVDIDTINKDSTEQ